MEKDERMFWIGVANVAPALAGVILLFFYTRATYEQVQLIRQQSATMNGQLVVMGSQLREMKSSSEQTERAIKASNRIADAAAQSVMVSDRLARAAAESTAESHRLANASNEANATARRLADAAIEGNSLSRRLAESAAQSAEINKRALVAVQRPFMFVKHVEFVKFVDFLTFHLRVIWENSGNTPTKNLSLENGCVFSDSLLEDPYSMRESTFFGVKWPRQMNKYEMFVGPKQSTYAFGCIIPSILVAIDQIALRRFLLEHHFYLVGRAEYRDELNPEYLHVTEYCRVVVGLSLDPKLSILTGDTLPCSEHNCVDDECKKRQPISNSDVPKTEEKKK